MIKCQICGDAAHYMNQDKELIACEEHIGLHGEPFAECHDCGSNIKGYHYTYEEHIFCMNCYKDRTKAEFDASNDPGAFEW